MQMGMSTPIHINSINYINHINTRKKFKSNSEQKVYQSSIYLKTTIGIDESFKRYFDRDIGISEDFQKPLHEKVLIL